jgi:hypothetical protein
MKKTINKQQAVEIDTRAGFIRFGRSDENTPEEAGGPNKLWVEVQLQGAGDAWHRVREEDLSPAFINQLNKFCDDAATALGAT